MKNEEYESALKRVDTILNAQKGTPEYSELIDLVAKIETYEEMIVPELSTTQPNDNWGDGMTRFWPTSGPDMTSALNGSATVELVWDQPSGMENLMRITFPDGRILEIDYDWINAWKVIDPPNKKE